MNTDKLLASWRKASGSGLGRALFDRALRVAVPYSGTIRPRVQELEPGRAVVAIDDERRVRNHLGSVHAVALVNLGELTSGLALLTGLPSGMRGIVRGLSVEYLKKARGRLVARCEAEAPETREDQDTQVEARIEDTAGDVVAIVRVDWRVGPVKG